jgi:hypothetical protein
MARQRKAKLRAQRIERDYYLRRHWFRSLRVWLTLAALVAVALWIGPMLGGRPHPASPGRLAGAHTLYEVDCPACHVKGSALPAAGGTAAGAPPLFVAASDGACRTCHAVPNHHTNQASTPTCASCHVEHRALPSLSAVATAVCTDCHVDLPRHTRGAPAFVRDPALDIKTFADGDTHAPGVHPEFAVWTGSPDHPQRQALDTTPPPRDMAHLGLNHSRHLQPDLLGPSGNLRVQLVCGDCHWGTLTTPTPRFGTRGPGWSPPVGPDLAPAETTPYMAPVRYAQHCAACHPNTFADVRFPGLVVPHDRPAVVHDFLRGLYADYVARHPEELRGTPRPRPIAGGATARSAPSADAWIAERVRTAEDVLYRTYDPHTSKPKYCIQCHDVTWTPGASLPTVVPTSVPIRWLPQSRFDHGVHRQLQCTECHRKVRDSSDTADVLMPDRGVCARCHRPGGAGTACSECHTYHAAIGPDEMNGRLGIEGLTRGN